MLIYTGKHVTLEGRGLVAGSVLSLLQALPTQKFFGQHSVLTNLCDKPIMLPLNKCSGERDIYGRKPRSCLGRVFNFKLGSSTDNTTNALNAIGYF